MGKVSLCLVMLGLLLAILPRGGGAPWQCGEGVNAEKSMVAESIATVRTHRNFPNSQASTKRTDKSSYFASRSPFPALISFVTPFIGQLSPRAAVASRV